MSTQKAMRATLEDCINNQELLLTKVDELIKQNRQVESEDERKDIQKLLARSCLGLDWRTKFEVIIHSKKISWPHLGYAIRRASYWTKDSNDRELDDLKPKDVWHAIKNSLFVVFSPALDKATSISKEILQYKKEVPRGYEWIPKSQVSPA